MKKMVWAALWLGLSTGALAQELRLVSGDRYAPYTDRTLPGQGLITHLVRRVLSEQGIAHSVSWQPWKRGYLNTLSGHYDGTFPYVSTAKRREHFEFSMPLYTTSAHLFSRAADHFEVADLAELRRGRLCTPLGWHVSTPLRELLGRGVLKRHAPANLTTCAELLRRGRDDLFVADRFLGQAALSAIGARPGEFHQSRSVLEHHELYLLVSKQNPQARQIIERFNQGLQRLVLTGEYERILGRHLGSQQ